VLYEHSGMEERTKTLVCIFEAGSPRTNAIDIQEWLYTSLRIPEEQVCFVQVDGPWKRAYVKFLTEEHMRSIVQESGGRKEYKHETGEISIVNIEVVGLGTRKVRIATLAPEIRDATVRAALTRYGEIHDIKHEQWGKPYRYNVANGIRTADITLKNHIPSQLVIAGTRVLITYEGQPTTCYTCNTTGHQSIDYPHRRSCTRTAPTSRPVAWADMVKYGARQSCQSDGPEMARMEEETEPLNGHMAQPLATGEDITNFPLPDTVTMQEVSVPSPEEGLGSQPTHNTNIELATTGVATLGHVDLPVQTSESESGLVPSRGLDGGKRGAPEHSVPQGRASERTRWTDEDEKMEEEDPRYGTNKKQSQGQIAGDPRTACRNREVSQPEMDKPHKGQVVVAVDDRRTPPPPPQHRGVRLDLRS
jgi:hypothetical protein